MIWSNSATLCRYNSSCYEITVCISGMNLRSGKNCFTSFLKRVYSDRVFSSLLERGFTLKGKNLLPGGANSFLLEKTLFRKDLLCRIVNRKPLTLVLLNLHIIWHAFANSVDPDQLASGSALSVI